MGTTLDRFFGGPVLSPRSPLEDFFNTGFFQPLVGVQNYRTALPQATVNQNDDGATVEIGLPGFTPEDVEVSVENKTLYISADRKGQSKEEDSGAATWQRSYQRSMTLPDGVDEESIAASIENGLLTIRIPRLVEDKKGESRRKIEINQSSTAIEGKPAEESPEGKTQEESVAA